jgi:hypothetical protein
MGTLGRPEAVGYPHVELAVLVPPGCDPGHEQLDELTAFLKGFFGVLLDLLEPLSERQEPRFGALGKLCLFAPISEVRLD